MPLHFPHRTLCIGLFIAGFSIKGYNQIKIGDNPTNINSNSLLELESTEKGLLLPRIALSATNSASPLSAFVPGMTVYNTASAGSGSTAVSPGLYLSSDTGWIRVTVTTEADLSKDAWADDKANSRVALSYLSDGITARPAGTEFVVNDDGSIGIGTATIDDNSLLELNSSSKALVLPRMTDAQMNAITSPLPGAVVHNTDNDCVYHYSLAKGWRSACASGSSFYVEKAANQDISGAGSIFSMNYNNTPLLNTIGASWDGTFLTINQTGMYSFEMQTGVGNLSADTQLIIGVLNASSNWIGRASYYSPVSTSASTGCTFSYRVVLYLMAGTTVSTGVTSSDPNYRIFAVESGTTGTGVVSSFSVTLIK